MGRRIVLSRFISGLTDSELRCEQPMGIDFQIAAPQGAHNSPVGSMRAESWMDHGGTRRFIETTPRGSQAGGRVGDLVKSRGRKASMGRRTFMPCSPMTTGSGSVANEWLD